ncbi:DUF354 domain-containing protein [Candidatus Cloacimonadota bacterium]
MIIWYDITNTPQVHFVLAIKEALDKRLPHKSLITTREFSETTQLLRKKTNEPFTVIGSHKGKGSYKKIGGLISRFYETQKTLSHFDASISCGSEVAIWSAALKGKKSIAFGDNDLAKQWTYGLFVSKAFFPDAIEESVLTRQGIRKHKLYRYHGYKEDLYLADYVPDNSFKDTMPFSIYVVVRPENLQANYINNDSARPITPMLLKELSKAGHNILYLPRYDIDRSYAEGIENIYIPEKPVNGLDACYYSDAVLTGAGTFAREAACLGVPSFSFFAGKSLLAVDKSLIKAGKMYFSRDVSELMGKLKTSTRADVDMTRSKTVQEEVITKLKEVIESW